jgi:uncharacterized protein YlxP (DUF503 family)
MFFALCRFELFIPQGRSLKGKRSVLAGIKERLRVRFHASVAEVGGQDLHQRGTLAVALVGNSPVALEAGLAAMRRLVEQEERCSITSWETRVEPFDGAPRAPRDQVLGGSAPASGADADGRIPDDFGEHWDEHEEGDEYFGPDRDRQREE